MSRKKDVLIHTYCLAKGYTNRAVQRRVKKFYDNCDESKKKLLSQDMEKIVHAYRSKLRVEKKLQTENHAPTKK
jgi:hypothetical protein